MILLCEKFNKIVPIAKIKKSICLFYEDVDLNFFNFDTLEITLFFSPIDSFFENILARLYFYLKNQDIANPIITSRKMALI